MKLKTRTVLKGAGSLSNLGMVKMVTALKFRLARVIKQVQDIVEDVEKSKKELFEREGATVNKKTDKYEWPSIEAEKRVERELEELWDIVVEVKFDKFSEESFEKLEVASLDLANCLWLFEGEDEDEEADNTEIV